jgi:hypothetical protein
LKLEGYLKLYENLPRLQAADGADTFVSDGEGTAKGVEVSLGREIARQPTVHLSYAWGSSEKTSSAASVKVPDRFDVRHTIIADCSLPVSANSTISARYRYATGRPYTPVLTRQGPGGSELYFGEQNSERLPAYRRLDLRLEIRLAERDELWGRRIYSEGTLYIELLNALNRKNVTDRVESIVEGQRVGREIWGDAMLPLVGIQIRFF